MINKKIRISFPVIGLKTNPLPNTQTTINGNDVLRRTTPIFYKMTKYLLVIPCLLLCVFTVNSQNLITVTYPGAGWSGGDDNDPSGTMNNPTVVACPGGGVETWINFDGVAGNNASQEGGSAIGAYHTENITYTFPSALPAGEYTIYYEQANAGLVECDGTIRNGTGRWRFDLGGGLNNGQSLLVGTTGTMEWSKTSISITATAPITTLTMQARRVGNVASAGGNPYMQIDNIIMVAVPTDPCASIDLGSAALNECYGLPPANLCYPTNTQCADIQSGTPNSNPASCNISAGEPTAVITIPAFDCADATAVTFETPVLPTTSSVLYHYWGNCAPNSPTMPENISPKSNGYIQQMFCETDGFGLPAFPGGLSGENGIISFLPQASEDVGANGFAQVGTCDGGGVGTDEKESELIQLDFWMAVPDIQSQVGFQFSTNNREDAASFFVGADLNAMCEVAYFTDGQNHDGLLDQLTGTFNIAPGQLTGTCGLLWLRVRVYINDIADQFEVNPQINAGAGWVDVDQLLIEPALSASDNTVPTVTTTTVSGYLIDGEFVYDDGGAWAPYGCSPVAAATDDGVCMLVVTDVELSAFNVTAKKETAVLDWTTVSETNSDKFIIERSHDGRSFSSIGEVKSNGNSKEEINYQLIDTRPLNGKSYYRLHEVSFDGTSDYSKIVSVDFTSKTNIEIYPNPASDQLFWKNVTEDLNYKMMNVHGQEVSSGLVNESSEALDLTTFSAGLYFMKIYNQNNEMTQVVKVYVH